jgi:hypothetical protein
MSSQKGISSIIAVIILAVVLIGGGAYYFKQQAKPVSKPIKEKTITTRYIEEYLHKDAILGGRGGLVSPTYHGISPEEAILFAIQHLQVRGAKEIKACETGWIAAPLGAFFVEGMASLDIGTKHYSAFSVVIRDGSDYHEERTLKERESEAVGSEAGFIARGEDDNGKVIWYPESGLEESSGPIGRLESLSSWCK